MYRHVKMYSCIDSYICNVDIDIDIDRDIGTDIDADRDRGLGFSLASRTKGLDVDSRVSWRFSSPPIIRFLVKDPCSKKSPKPTLRNPEQTSLDSGSWVPRNQEEDLCFVSPGPATCPPDPTTLKTPKTLRPSESQTL